MQDQNTDQPKRYQCRHIFTDGRRCGSICLRGEEFCYYHHTTRKPAKNPRTGCSRRATFSLPLPEDRSAIQHSIGEVLQRIAANDIDPRRAGLLLYGLQIARLNLPKPQPAHTKSNSTESIKTVDEITTHPELGTLAPPAEFNTNPNRRKSLIDLLMDDLNRRPNPETPTESQPTEPLAKEPEPEPAVLPTLQATATETLPGLRNIRPQHLLRAGRRLIRNPRRSFFRLQVALIV